MRVLIVTQGGADLTPLEARLRARGHTVVTVARDAEVPGTWRSGACALVVVDTVPGEQEAHLAPAACEAAP
ncbi:hypothetical protein ACLESO_45240, partial [Pyxidicoccus sp. 3LG]